MRPARLRLMPPPVDLPRPGLGVGGFNGTENRWVPSRKEAVVTAVQTGQISLSQAERDYALSFDEFLSWAIAFDMVGRRGLRAVKGLAETRPGTRYRVPYTASAPREIIPADRHRGVSLPRMSFTAGGRHG